MRAVAIAEQRQYDEVYYDLYEAQNETPRAGVVNKVLEAYLRDRGWRPAEFGPRPPHHVPGRIIADMDGHVFAMVDGVVLDMRDPTLNGKRDVLGYYWRR